VTKAKGITLSPNRISPKHTVVWVKKARGFVEKKNLVGHRVGGKLLHGGAAAAYLYGGIQYADVLSGIPVAKVDQDGKRGGGTRLNKGPEASLLLEAIPSGGGAAYFGNLSACLRWHDTQKKQTSTYG